MVRHSTRPLNAPERDIPDAAALPEDQRARRQRIIDAARKLMISEDYGKIQVKDVAEDANVSLGTLYRYFSSKDHLFACALADWAAPAEAAAGNAGGASGTAGVAGTGGGTGASTGGGTGAGTGGGRKKRAEPGGSTPARVRAMLHVAARAFEDAPRVYGALMQLQVSADPYAQAEYRKFSRRQLDGFAGAVADVPESYRDDILVVLGSVLAESLRAYGTGMYPMSGVYERLDRAVRLTFRAPFE